MYNQRQTRTFAHTDSYLQHTFTVHNKNPFSQSKEIASEGEVSQITAEAFIKRHKLASASAVQYAAKQLMSKGYITKLHGQYSLNEQFFGLWINQLYGKGSVSAWR